MKPTRPIRSWSHAKSRDATAPSDSRAVTPTKWDRRFQRAAHLSAPLAFILALVGYFYTVRPVFQYQRLQEQAAKVEMDKAAAEQQLAKLRLDQQKIESDIQVLGMRYEQEKARNSQLASDASAARTREAEAQRRAADARANADRELKRLAAAEAAMNAELGKLDKARWELVLHDLLWQIAIPRYNRVGYFFDDDKPAFIKVEQTWVVPDQAMLSAISALEVKNRKTQEIPESYYAELRAVVAERSAALQCPKPDFNQLRAQFAEDLQAIGPEVESYVTKEVDKIRAEYAAKGQAVKITDEFRASLRRAGTAGAEYRVQNRHREKMQELAKVCDDKIDAVMAALRKAKGATR